MFARRLPPQALASTLERRHVQLERLAGIQPEFVAQSDAGRFLRIRGGKIGTISGAVTAPKLREALESQLYDPALAGPATLISESLAQAAAVKAMEAQIKDHLGEHELQQPTDLFFHFEPSAQTLVPYYNFFIRADRTEGSWLVQVNASNADARIAAKPQGD